MASVVRIGNASGFYGDRFAAFGEMLDGGRLDVLTGDYLAELTMLILARDRAKDPALGYAKTFLKQLEHHLGTALDKGVKIVTNAGGLNPAGLADNVRALAERLGLEAKVAHVEGDDLLPRAHELGIDGSGNPLAANAYLGAWGIAACLTEGADIVVTGRVTDASLVVGPAAAHHGWGRTDYDQLAGAVAAGHVIECGTQATGGNYAFFQEIKDLRRPGFPIAEVHADGSSVITKHEGTGGAVTTGTVTAQLLYEIGGVRYAGPDVTTRMDSVRLSEEAQDRVRITDVKGEPPPPTLKVSVNRLGGYRNEVEFVLTGLDIEAKAALVRQQLKDTVPADVEWALVRTDHVDADTEERASATLRCVARGADPKKVGRAFSNAAVEIGLASYPGFHLTTPPGEAAPYGVFEPAYVDASLVDHVAVLPDGSRKTIAPATDNRELEPVEEPSTPLWKSTIVRVKRAPLGTIVGARSGDKGGSANIGVWVRSDDAFAWLTITLTADKLRELLPETMGLSVERHMLPHLRAVNFVIDGILGKGVAYNARFDPQAKALGEWLRSRLVDLPEDLLE